MSSGTRRGFALLLLAAATVAAAVGIGAGTGLFIARTRNIQRTLDVGAYTPALPSLILDRRGKLITRFFAEEKREILTLEEISPHLIHAALAREDRGFYSHIGFSLKGFVRAAWNIITGNYFSGGSTISQQVAGTLYEDREIKTLGRKLKELFWSLQLEKNRSKEEILQVYLNNSSFGHGTYGVEAAAQFYFGHSARDMTPAESAMLVTQLTRINSLLRNPNRAKAIQRATLDAMVELSFVSKEEADASFDEFWHSYDPTRSNATTAYTERHDEAPYFSELVRRQFEQEFYGSSDLYRDGYVIHTTLDLEYQRLAESLLERKRKELDVRYRAVKRRAVEVVETSMLPVLELLSGTFGAPVFGLEEARKEREAIERFAGHLDYPLEALSLMFGDGQLLEAVFSNRRSDAEESREDEVQGALVSIDNETGYILAMVGGSDFSTIKFNIAADSRLSPGSAVKPLYYAEAIESGTVTPATMLYDSPAVFVSPLNPPYAPRNFLGSWNGPVSVREALSASMNVPSIKVLDSIGLDAAIESIAEFLMTDKNRFPRAYPIGLGTIGVSPLDMATAYAVFPRQGRTLKTLAIRYIEDRYGEVIFNNEQEILSESAKRPDILTPPAAYVMTDLLTTTVTDGTLSRRVAEAGGLGNIPMAGKTGTTENWSDAWTVGFSPYITTAVWYGFLMPGNSLGRYQTGALAAGPVWVEYMKETHKDLPYKGFEHPDNGVISRRVCSVSGLLPTEECPEIVDELFLTGTEPEDLCTYHQKKHEIDEKLLRGLTERFRLGDTSRLRDLLPEPESADAEEGSQGDVTDSYGPENPLMSR